MLPKGSISQVYEYYFTSPGYKEEVMRAMREFFDRSDLKQGDYLEDDETSSGLFNEWFLYDFLLANGRTVLADFVTENPFQLSRNELKLYLGLLKTHVYGLYEVVSVDTGKGLTLKNLQTGEKVYVQERALTSQVNPGSIFFGRIGQVNDHHELVGADTFLLGGLNERAKKSLLQTNFELTAKTAHEIWVQGHHERVGA